jgi:hypothetical protein
MRALPALLCAILMTTIPAWAGLGETVGSVRIDQAMLRGKLASFARQGYSMQQITAPDGAIVKEYVSPGGIVFGIAWQGPAMPNLAQLLGPYFSQFEQAAQSRRARRAPLVLNTSQLVVESGGHLRSFHGRAYVPGLLPSNVSEAEVR